MAHAQMIILDAITTLVLAAQLELTCHKSMTLSNCNATSSHTTRAARRPAGDQRRLVSKYETLSGYKFDITFDHAGYRAVISVIV